MYVTLNFLKLCIISVKEFGSWVLMIMPVILASQEVNARNVIQGQLGHKVQDTP
jgi:hypothetical protein